MSHPIKFQLEINSATKLKTISFAWRRFRDKRRLSHIAVISRGRFAIDHCLFKKTFVRKKQDSKSLQGKYIIFYCLKCKFAL